MPLNIPDEELDLLVNTVDLALSRAEKGDVAAGCSELMYGLERAAAAHEAGEEWGAQLVERWRDVLDRYNRRFGGGTLKARN